MPCAVFDHCEESSTATSCQDEPDTDCPPFSSCCNAHGFHHELQLFSVLPIELYSITAFPEYPHSFTGDYYSRPFQPPRTVSI